MDVCARDYYEDIKIKKSGIYRNFNSKKKFKMYFEKLSAKERKKYMEEKNYKEMNINTITWDEAKKLNKETKTFLINTLIEKYGDNDSCIGRNTALKRFNIATLRKECGLNPGRGLQYNRIGRKIDKENLIKDNTVINLPITPIEEVEYAEPTEPAIDQVKDPEPIQEEVKPVECKSFKDVLSFDLEGTYFKEVLSLDLDCDGENARTKLESLLIFLDLNKNYNIELKISEKR